MIKTAMKVTIIKVKKDDKYHVACGVRLLSNSEISAL